MPAYSTAALWAWRAAVILLLAACYVELRAINTTIPDGWSYQRREEVSEKLKSIASDMEEAQKTLGQIERNTRHR